jgi:hypothetical protein
VTTCFRRALHRVGCATVSTALLLGAFGIDAQATTSGGRLHAGKTLHVSPTGSDSANGSARSPLRTAQLAVDRLGSRGGTVEFSGGRYTGQRVLLKNRAHVTLRAASGATPILDGAGLKPVKGSSGMIEIRNSSKIKVIGLTITGYRTRSTAAVPIGIYVVGSGNGIVLRGNHVHHLGNDNPTLGSYEMNAHGIAVYGTNPKAAIKHVRITGNRLDHLVLGASESLVLNGNVDGWSVTENVIHDNNNIGIDAIGYEPTISGKARFTEVNRARNGLIARNRVSRIRSEGNPAYYEDGAWCNCADGIYIDGGTRIVVADNRVDSSDIGIEVASEWAKGRTNDIRVQGNTVTRSRYTGIAVGGYDQDRGEAFDLTVTRNFLRGNNTLKDGSPELLLQYYVHDTSITKNTIISTNREKSVLIARVTPKGGAAKNGHLTLRKNRFAGRARSGAEVYVWNGVEYTGLAAYRKASHQDAGSTYRRR